MNKISLKKRLLLLCLVICIVIIIVSSIKIINKYKMYNSSANEKNHVNNISTMQEKEATSKTSTLNKTNKSTNEIKSSSIAEKYSVMASSVDTEPSDVTISRWSDKDIDSPVIPGNLIKNKIISEELKITKRCKTEISDTDKKWLTCVVYHETASEPYEGKLAAANVILNMYYDTSGCFEDTITGIVFQEGVFAATKDCKWNETVETYDTGKFTTENHLLAVKAVDEALNGKNNIGTRLCFNFYYMEKNNNHKNAVRIQNELYWDR